MPTMSMIDTHAKMFEATAPAKASAPKREDFNKALEKQQEPRNEQPKSVTNSEQSKSVTKAEQPKSVAKSEQPEKSASKDRPEQVAAGKEQAEQKAVQHEPQAQPHQQVAATGKEQATPKLQQLLKNLMQTIAQGETPAAQDGDGSIDEMLTQLVQQLKDSDLQGEQVLAGIDLSALVNQLQTLSGAADGEQQLAQLVTRLKEQLTKDANLLAGAQQVAALLAGNNPQVTSQHLPENLAQARQMLQQAIDEVAGQQPAAEPQLAVAEDADSAAEQPLEEAKDEKIDPRFAHLLKPRQAGEESLRQRVQGANAKPATVPNQGPTEAAAVKPEKLKPEHSKAEIAELLGKEAQPKAAQPNPHVAGQVQMPQAQGASARSMPNGAPAVQLPSGQQVAESQIFDQVVTRVSGSFNGESGKMVLRLQPAELGSLKLELMVEGDKVRANFLAQTQQVQQVLERNLPQLRNALAEQGLQIDQFQVNVDQQQQQGHFDHLAQQQDQRRSSRQPSWQQPVAATEQIIPLAHLMQNGGGGLSLHV